MLKEGGIDSFKWISSTMSGKVLLLGESPKIPLADYSLNALLALSMHPIMEIVEKYDCVKSSPKSK